MAVDALRFECHLTYLVLTSSYARHARRNRDFPRRRFHPARSLVARPAVYPPRRVSPGLSLQTGWRRVQS